VPIAARISSDVAASLVGSRSRSQCLWIEFANDCWAAVVFGAIAVSVAFDQVPDGMMRPTKQVANSFVQTLGRPGDEGEELDVPRRLG
jgi:hypothetical protein